MSVDSARENGTVLAALLPSQLERASFKPSVHDVFKNNARQGGGLVATYTDRDEPVQADTAYVFRKENTESRFKYFDLNSLLGLKDLK